MPALRMQNIAHRGARAHAPENTLAAARLAHELGADMWETDVALTADGHMILVHDDTLARTTDVAMRPEFADRAPWPVQAFTLAEARSLDAGSWFGEADPFKTIASGEVGAARLASYLGETIPTLDEGLALTKKLGWRINVEIKDHAGCPGHETITRQVIEAVRRHGLEGAVLLSSFQHEYLREAAEIIPSVPRGALLGKARKKGPDQSAQNDPGFVPSLNAEQALAMCRYARADFIHPELVFADAPFVAALHDGGFPAIVWTVNTKKDIERMRASGVYGVFTDYPARLQE